MPMLKNKNPCEEGAPRRRIHRLPVPRRAIHPHLLLVIPSRTESAVRNLLFSLVILSEAIGRRRRAAAQLKSLVFVGTARGPTWHFHYRTDPLLIPPHNNPVIAQNLNIL